MALHDEFEATGNWLFRWRSYLGFAFVPILAFGIATSAQSYETAISPPWILSSFLISLSGLAIRVHCIGHAPEGTSGRNRKKQIANVLNTTGCYSVVRHPLYVGNFLIALGIVVLPANVLVTLTYVLTFILYYERIMFTEESFLTSKFGSRYLEWASRTPAVLPRVRNWARPAEIFDALKSIERECAALAVIVVSFTFVRATYDLTATGEYRVGGVWIGFVVASLMIYTFARVLKARKRRPRSGESLMTPT